MSNVFFTADLHLGHGNIIKYCNRPFLTDLDKQALLENGGVWHSGSYKGDGASYWNITKEAIKMMDDTIINNINRDVKDNDRLFILGDFAFGSLSKYQEYKDRIKCENIILIRGNHDHYNVQSLFETYDSSLFNIHPYGNFYLNHYANVTWEKSHRGSIHLYGHCIDDQSEILTTSGWKNYLTIDKNNTVFSYKDGKIIKNSIEHVIINTHTIGNIYVYDTKIISIAVTPNHRMLIDNDQYIYAKDFFNKDRSNVILSGILNTSGISLDDNLLKLYIYIAADGSFNDNTKLSRLRVFKIRKIELFRDILKKLNLIFSENVQKDGSICFNFHTPKEILNFNIKGLDWQLLNCNSHQVDIILQAYSETDGYLNQEYYPCIFTSKEQEKDILQALFCLHGHKVTCYTRIGHGFSKKPNYQISIVKNKNNLIVQPKKYGVLEKYSGVTWCIKTEIGNFICRRKGKVFITGNSHGALEDYLDRLWPDRRSMDVGVDNACFLTGEYKPFPIQYIMNRMKNRKGSNFEFHVDPGTHEE